MGFGITLCTDERTESVNLNHCACARKPGAAPQEQRKNNLPDRKASTVGLAGWLAVKQRQARRRFHHNIAIVVVVVVAVDELTNLYRASRAHTSAIFGNFLSDAICTELTSAYGFNICKQLAICTNY